VALSGGGPEGSVPPSPARPTAQKVNQADCHRDHHAGDESNIGPAMPSTRIRVPLFVANESGTRGSRDESENPAAGAVVTVMGTDGARMNMKVASISKNMKNGQGNR